MATPAFPGMESNNAPLPIPGGYGNPTGVQAKPIVQSGKSQTGGAFPQYPAFGPLNVPSATPTTPAANAPVYGPTNLQGLSSGVITKGMKTSNQSDKLFKDLANAYGPGMAAIIHNLLNQGTFNPQVASAFLNAMQPGIQRGEADISSAFGEAGSRFSSSAALGMGDYLSQVNLNEQQTLANLYEQSINQELNLTEGLLPTLHQEHANKGGIMQDILGGLEIAGGLIGAPFTGGMSLGLVGSGVGTLLGGNKGGGGQQTPNVGGAFGSLFNQGSPVDMSNVSMGPTPAQSNQEAIQQIIQASSGGAVLGGNDPYGTNPNSDTVPGMEGMQGKMTQLMQMLMNSGAPPNWIIQN